MRIAVERNTKQAILRVVTIVVCAMLMLECYAGVVVIASLVISGQQPVWALALAVLVAIGASRLCLAMLKHRW